MRFIGSDTETHLIIPHGLLAPPMVCGTFAERPDSAHVDRLLYLREPALDAFEAMLHDPEVTLVLHNAAFDMAVICAARPRLLKLVFDAYKVGRIRCTLIREQLIDIAAGRIERNGVTMRVTERGLEKAVYHLADLAYRYFGKDRSAQKEDPNGWRKRFAELEHLTIDRWPGEAVEYALEDAIDALDAFHAQTRRFKKFQVEGDTFPCEIDATCNAWVLHLISCWGIRTDEARVNELEAMLRTKRDRNLRLLQKVEFVKPKRLTPSEIRDGATPEWERDEIKLTKISRKRAAALPPEQVYTDAQGSHFHKTSQRFCYRWARDNARIQSYFVRAFAKKGLTAPLTAGSPTRKPVVATDKDTAYVSGSRLLRLVADGGGIDKILNTFVPVLKLGILGPIQARFNALVNSFRTSCGGPNLQNLPTGKVIGGVRECFIPRPGFFFCSVDYDTLELRALAQMCLWFFGTSKMAEVINAGQDLHSAFAAGLMGIAYEEFEKRRKAGDKECKRYRNLAKVFNFGAPGGLGAGSMVDYARAGYGVTIAEDEARGRLADYKRLWPEMPLYFNRASQLVGLSPDGIQMTHKASGFIRGALTYTNLCNNEFQHLAAFGAKRAGFQLAYECYVDESSPLFGSRIVNFIHDEYILEVPEHRAHEAAMRQVEVMCAEMQTVIPDVKITASPALCRRWYKDATAVYDAAGRLIPWEPPPAKAA